jgi:hypothetical protein
VTNNEPRFVTHVLPSGRLASEGAVSHKENNMRRILLTLAVALFSVAAPAVPASASAFAHKSHPKMLRPNPLTLALDKLRHQREFLDLEAHRTLDAVASSFHLSLQQLVDKWQRVAICEVNGDWDMEGPLYSGIGFSNATWVRYGGNHFAPTAGKATPLEQIAVGMRITRTWIPDQYGCSRFGW